MQLGFCSHVLHQHLFTSHPHSFHSPIPTGVSDGVQCWRVTPTHPFSLDQTQLFGNGNGYSSHFPNFSGAPLSHPIFLLIASVIFHSFLPSLVDVILAFISRALQTHLSAHGKVGISPSQELQCLLADSCSCWECWFAGHLGCTGLVGSPPTPPMCLGPRVLRGTPLGSMGCCGSLPRTIFQGLQEQVGGYPALAPSDLSLVPTIAWGLVPAISGAFGACSQAWRHGISITHCSADSSISWYGQVPLAFLFCRLCLQTD